MATPHEPSSVPSALPCLNRGAASCQTGRGPFQTTPTKAHQPNSLALAYPMMSLLPDDFGDSSPFCGGTNSAGGAEDGERIDLRALLKRFDVDKSQPGWKWRFLQYVATGAASPDDMWDMLVVLRQLSAEADTGRRLLAVQVVYAALNWGLVDDFGRCSLIEVLRTLLHDPDTDVRSLAVPLLAVLLAPDPVSRRKCRSMEAAAQQEAFFYSSVADEQRVAAESAKIADARVWRFVHDMLHDEDDTVVKIAVATLLFTLPRVSHTHLERVGEQLEAAKANRWATATDCTPAKLLVDAVWRCTRWVCDERRQWFVDPLIIKQDFHNRVPGRVRRWWRRKRRAFDNVSTGSGDAGHATWFRNGFRRVGRWMTDEDKAEVRKAVQEVRARVVRTCEGDGEQAKRMGLGEQGGGVGASWWEESDYLSNVLGVGMRVAAQAADTEEGNDVNSGANQSALGGSTLLIGLDL